MPAFSGSTHPLHITPNLSIIAVPLVGVTVQIPVVGALLMFKNNMVLPAKDEQDLSCRGFKTVVEECPPTTESREISRQ